MRHWSKAMATMRKTQMNRQSAFFVVRASAVISLIILGTPSPSSAASDGSAEFSLTAPSEIGAILPKSDYQFNSTSNEWIEIPSWLAGTWCEYMDPPTGTEAREKDKSAEIERQPEMRLLTLGMKADSHGSIFHYAGVPWVRTTERSGLIEKQTVDSFKPIKSLPEGLSMISTAKVTISDAKTGAVKEKFKQEVMSTYLPVSDGKIRIHTTTYKYSMDDSLISRTEQSATGARLAGFIPWNSAEMNLKFRQFSAK
jgi:hypothetical protein